MAAECAQPLSRRIAIAYAGRMRFVLLLLPLLLAACSTARAPVPPPAPRAERLVPGITPLTVEQERELQR
ncbi:MAG TPA: hypothetical protein VNS02_01160 [Rhizobiaceae bacterium]|nr:hypothetical protein [Rhizobiaceae bacterium]